MKTKIFLLLFLILSACAQSNSSGGTSGQNTANLISYQKYDFVNSTYISNSELIIGFYTNGFTLSKTGCETLFFQSSDTALPTGGAQKSIIGDNYSSGAYCFPARVQLDITDSSQVINGHESYSVKILSDLYNMLLE